MWQSADPLTAPLASTRVLTESKDMENWVRLLKVGPSWRSVDPSHSLDVNASLMACGCYAGATEAHFG